MKYEGNLYAGNKFIGVIASNSLRGIRMIASKKCNDYYQPIDELRLFRVDDKENGTYILTRINKKAPNNTIIRGQWR